MPDIKIEDVLLEKIKPNEYNPKGMTEKEKKELKNSIVKFGIVDPVILNSAPEREGVIIGGSQRYKIYAELGYKKIPAVWVNIPNIEKERELCLRLSKNTGPWNYDLLAKFDEDLLKNIGFDESELDSVFGYEMDDEFDMEKEFRRAVKKPIGVKPGDLWKLGEHMLYVGDSTKEESWQKVLGNERIDFLFTDPPYRIGYGHGTRKQKTNSGVVIQKFRTYTTVGTTTKDGKPFDAKKSPAKYFGMKENRGYLGVDKKGGVPEFDEWLSLANDYQNPKGINVMIFENWKNTVDLWQAIEKYWKIKNMVIWWLPNRTQGFSAPGMFFKKYDIAPLAGEGAKNEEYEKELEDYLRENGQKLLDTYEVILHGSGSVDTKSGGAPYWDRPKGTRWARITDHITWNADSLKSSGQGVVFGTKPLQVLVPYIKILSPREGIVMDPFGGSGSTLIACQIMKRRCRMIEMSEVYSEVIISRFQKFTGIKPEKVRG